MPTPSQASKNAAADETAASATTSGRPSSAPGTSPEPSGISPAAALSSAGQTVSAALPSLSGRVDQRRLLWWGGLAAAGTIGLLEWPVVAAVGIGSYVAEQFAKNGQTPQQRPTVPAPPYTAPTA